MDHELKKRFIFDNIKNVQNTSVLISFIDQNDINYSENSNGIFFNLSCFSNEKIDKLYSFILSIIDRETNEKKYFENIMNCSLIENKEDVVHDTIEYEEIKLSNLENLIISKIT